MGIKNIEARHITLVLQGCTPRFEIQLLHYMNPPVLKDPNTTDLHRTGYNHLALRVENLDSEVNRLKEAAVLIKNQKDSCGSWPDAIAEAMMQTVPEVCI